MCFYNHEINAEMLLVTVLRGSMRVLFFLTLLKKSECEESLSNATKYSNEIPKPMEKKNFFMYTNQHFNESLEKIRLMEKGTVMKSAYIPIVPNNELNLNYSQIGKEIYDGENFTSEKKQKPTTKENVVVKNGKKYRVVKVKKTKVKTAAGVQENHIQRRTFRLLPNFMSFIPLTWMTRGKKNGTVLETRSENGTQWSNLMPHSGSDDSREILQQGSEKVKKLLNLFTIVKFENGECYADGIKGTCLHQAECEAEGGKFTATCAQDLGVCCYFEKTCGETSSHNCTYFINEDFPHPSTTAPKVCTLTLERASPHVKQLRLDFQIFQLRGPTNGTCLHDRLVVSGQNMNDVIPEICGANTGQHIYVDVEDSRGPFNLNIVTMGEYFHRNFRIKVTQVKKEDELLAPKNCLQFYSEPAGYVQTFNYQQNVHEHVQEIDNGYFNNLNYAICIKKHKGFCSISYQNEEEGDGHPTFHLVNVDEDGKNLLPPRQAGAETFDCPDDYIIINGIRLCGEKLNDASVEIDYTRNYPVTDTTNGPFILSVRTDATVSGRGFHLKFLQHPCPN